MVGITLVALTSHNIFFIGPHYWLGRSGNTGQLNFSKQSYCSVEHTTSPGYRQSNELHSVLILQHYHINMFVISNLPAPGSIAVLLFREYGEEIINFLDKGFTVYIQMKPGPMGTFGTNMQNNISKTSVLFVSISFVVLMIVSLAWLVFYYIQRFRYSHAKERLAVSSFFFQYCG